ncbi:MAG TPA: hypothetical protein VNV15_09045 [Opitutaceae bacterium]|jgi:hypothetical protein|nr:hypothetical protein [Opitutaceae bacterium]
MTVLILTISAALMAGALLAYATGERRLNRHLLLRLQAQDAAEATLEYGAAQVAALAVNNHNVPTTYFSTTNPITLDSLRIATLYSAASPNPSTFPSTNNYVQTNSTSLWVSNVTTAGLYSIDANDPRNNNDPLVGLTENVQTVRLLSQATASDNNGNSITDYATEAIEIREASLFQWAVFYNVTMEFGPSSQVDVYGPVFSNSNTYLSQSGGNLTFHGSFKTAGTFSEVPVDDVSGAGANRPQGQNINFTDDILTSSTAPDPNPVAAANAGGDSSEYFYPSLDPTIKVGSSSLSLGTNIWVDSFLNSSGNQTSTNSTLATWSFQQVANYLWNGQVGDSSMGVVPLETPGVTTTTSATAHDIIQPPDPTGTTSDQIESTKFSNNAGIYIVVEPNADSGATGAIVTAFGPTGSGSTYQSAAQNALLYEYGSLANETAGIKQNAAARATWITNNPTKILTLPAAAGSGSTATAATVTTTRLIYDQRESKKINTVDIDVGVLATAIGTSGGSLPSSPTALQSAWNGVVYVDVQTDSQDSNPATGSGSATIPSGWATTSDMTASDNSHAITGTGTETAVRLIDASQLPSMGSAPGTSIATNAPVYVIGQYNGNEGTSLTGDTSPTEAQVMTPDTNEVPAMIAGDSMNLLSNAWATKSGSIYTPTGDGITTNHDGTGSGNTAAASDTLYDAAFLSGNVATASPSGSAPPGNPTGTYSYSGGVENYMRFSEDWSGGTVARYRGSVVALYNSEVATGPWGNAKYSVPTRQMAFDDMFEGPTATNGYTKAAQMPPGCPHIYTLQFVGYTDINNATFTTMKNDANYGFVSVN